jgi:hypothetical protein
MPQRPGHIPHANERTALQKLKPGEGLPIEKMHPAGRATVEKMVAKGWLELGSDTRGRRTYCVTAAGQEALRTPIP